MAFSLDTACHINKIQDPSIFEESVISDGISKKAIYNRRFDSFKYWWYSF